MEEEGGGGGLLVNQRKFFFLKKTGYVYITVGNFDALVKRFKDELDSTFLSIVAPCRGRTNTTNDSNIFTHNRSWTMLDQNAGTV